VNASPTLCFFPLLNIIKQLLSGQNTFSSFALSPVTKYSFLFILMPICQRGSLNPSAVNQCICLLWQAVTGEMRSVIHEEHMHSICKQCSPSHYIFVLILNVTVSRASLTGTVQLGLRLHTGLATLQIHTYISIYTPLSDIEQDIFGLFSAQELDILESGGFVY